MARVALGIAGFAIAGPLGGFIGSTLGGVVDSFLFAGKQEGPRLDDLRVTASTYGQPMPLIYGPENRVSGNIIWSSGLIETKTTKRAGKGGPKVTTYSYSVDLAILLSARPIGRVTKIMGNSKVIFDLAAAAVAPAPPTDEVGMVITAANAAGAVFETLRVYQGTATQAPDPTIEAALGMGQTPAYRHRAYVVIQGLQLADYGNAIPNLEFFVEADAAITDAAIVADICARAGITDAVASRIDNPRRGYVVARAASATAALEPLQMAGAFDLTEQWGEIRFVPRGLGMSATLEPGDLGAGSGAAEASPVRHERVLETDMPRSATVSFADPALDLQVNSQEATRDIGSSANDRAAELAVTMDVDAAARVADQLLWGDYASRRTAKTSVSDRWIDLPPGRTVGVPIGGQVLPFKVSRRTRGSNGVTETELTFEDPLVFQSDRIGAAGVLPANPLKLPGVTRLVLMDAPMLRPGDDDTGFYWAATGAEAGWRGAEILRSSDAGASYNSMSSVGVRAPMGDVATALGDGSTVTVDLANSLEVVLAWVGDALESVPDTALLNGANAAWLGPADGAGGEIIQFGEATVTGPSTWRLSRLLRGRMGTDWATASHGANEVLVLLEPASLGRSDYGAGDWDAERDYKPVSLLTAEADTAAQAFINTGEAKRPLAPVSPSGSRDGGDNLTVTFYRRSRIAGPGVFAGPPPLGEETEAYEIDILDGATVVRTITASTTSFVYSAADQSADGLTPGDPVSGRIHQISAIRGRGHPLAFTV